MWLRKSILQFSVYFVILFLLSGLETAFWPNFFPWIMAPSCWLCVLLYLSLYRDVNEGFVTVYLLAISMSLFTLTPFGILIFLSSFIFFLSRFIKDRVFWPRRSYFALMTAAFVPIVFLIHWLISYFLERNSISRLSFFSLMGESLITALVAAPLYDLFRWADRRLDIEDLERETF